MILSNWYHPPRAEYLWIDREEYPRRWEGQGQPYTMGTRGTMYPALSSVHTNTLNFVHILIQAFFVFLRNLFWIYLLHFWHFRLMQHWALHLLWLKQRKLTLSHIDLNPISINRTFLRALQKGGKGSYCSPLYRLLYLTAVWLWALRKPRGGEREVIDVAVKDSRYV